MKKDFFKSKLCINLCTILLTSSSIYAQESIQLDEITINPTAGSDFQNTKNIKLNRTGVDIENTAKSIQVFNRAFIEKFQLQNIENIIELSSNSVYTGDTDGKTTNISMRGFSNVPILIDGLKITNSIAHPETYNYESIEIQKGPDSLQYGQSSPGGIVNLVKKKPTKDSRGNITLEVNDNPSYSTKVDIGGSINKDQSLYFRLISTLTNDKGYTNSNTDKNAIFIAPSLSYDINDNNTITFISEYTDEKTPTYFGNNINKKGKLIASIKDVVSHPDEEFNKTQKIIGFDVDSTFDTWNSNFKYRYINHIRDYNTVMLPLSFIQETTNVTRYSAIQRQEFSENALQYTLNKKSNIFGLKNNISIGADYNKAYSKLITVAELTAHNIDITNPSYEKSILPLNYDNYILDLSEDKSYQESWGVFLQDTINLTNDLTFNAGLRYSESKPQNGKKSDALSPSLGLVYKATPQTSIYTSYSESFTPNTSTDINKNILDPETGKGLELGIKQKLFNENFNLTAALFKIKKTNIALNDPNDPFGLASISSGEQESQGIEVDLNGQITDNLSLVASYGYTTTKDKSNGNKELKSIPKNSANIFSTYQLTTFNLPNIYIGGGVRYIGSRFFDNDNTIKFDSEIIYNVNIGYQKDNWKLNLSVQNLTDERYVNGKITGSSGDYLVNVGTPRTVLATLSYSF